MAYDDGEQPRKRRGRGRCGPGVPSLNGPAIAVPRPPDGYEETIVEDVEHDIVASPESDQIALLDTQIDDSRQNHHGSLQNRVKLTPDKVKRVLASIRGYSPPDAALRGAGISKQVFATYQRLAEDEQAHPIYRIFIDDFSRLVEEVCRKIVHNANEVARVSEDVRWHMYLLERMEPAFQAKVRIEVDHQVNVQLNAFVMACEAEFPPEIFERILEVAATLKPGEAVPCLPSAGRRG